MTRRRTAFVVAGAVAALAGVGALTSRPNELARSDDGKIAVIDAAYDSGAPWRTSVVNFLPALRVRRRTRSTAHFLGRPFLGLMVACGSPDGVRIDASCGCRFATTPVTFNRGEFAVGTETFPRRDPELRVRFGDDGPVLVVPSPAPLAPPAVGPDASDLPLTVRTDDVSWTLTRRTSDPGGLELRAVDANGSGTPWRHFGARLSDASGNVAPRNADDREAVAHRIALPTAVDLWRLCPHEPWWELTVNVEGREPLTFRFRPPR